MERCAGMHDQGHSWLLVNARSGSNSNASVAELEQALAERRMSPRCKLELPNDPLPTLTQLDRECVDRLVVFTGDGTLNAVIGGLAGWCGEVLVLPGGTMNLLSLRLHGEAAWPEIIDRIARGASRPVRPRIVRCGASEALAGLLVGPGTAWANVREAMRDGDMSRMARGASGAVAQTVDGARVRFVDGTIGRDEGYPLIEITPGNRGLQIDAYVANTAAQIAQHGWALLRRSFREGPHERLGLLDCFELESCGNEPLDALIDGEIAQLESRASFAVARCRVDLLATDHGF